MEMRQNQTFFHGSCSNLTPYTFLSKNIEVFQWLSKSKFLSSMTKMNPDNENETKSDIYSSGTFKSDIIFVCCQNTKIFQDLHNWHLSISLHKWVQTKIKIKRGMCKSDSIFVIYKMVHYLNDFWDLFLAKVFLKMNDKQLRRKNLFRLIQFGKY